VKPVRVRLADRLHATLYNPIELEPRFVRIFYQVRWTGVVVINAFLGARMLNLDRPVAGFWSGWTTGCKKF
jgi:hypothetical protein